MKLSDVEGNSIIDLYRKLPQILRYILISCMATVIDVAVVWVLYRTLGFGVVYANTVGVLCGFMISYLLSARYVFSAAGGMVGFLAFFSTFLGALLLADILIYWGENSLFADFPPDFGFLCSKGLSIALPFFITYFTRKHIYIILQNRAFTEDKKSKK